jgi:hypothetical protein
MAKLIQFRPHHFLCSVAYEGMGYSKPFVANFDRIAQEIRHDEDIKIQVVFGLDAICSHCPHQNLNSHTCNDQILINKLDNAHARILKIKDQEIISFRDAKERIRKNMDLRKFYAACAPCEWQKMGVCENALKKLKAEV